MKLSVRAFKSAALNFYRCYFSLPYVASVEEFCAGYESLGQAGRTLDLGCGKTPRNPFNALELYGVDVDHGIDESKRILPCDLGVEPLPFPDDCFDFITAFDLIEHIPRLIYRGKVRLYPFINLMSECHRVLKAGGVFLSDTPAYPRFSAYADPTHVNVITAETFRMYFCRPHVWAERYGFNGGFALIKQAWHEENLLTLIRKA